MTQGMHPVEYSARVVEAWQQTLKPGGKLTPSGLGAEPVAAFGPHGVLIALLEDRDDVARALAVFVG